LTNHAIYFGHRYGTTMQSISDIDD